MKIPCCTLLCCGYMMTSSNGNIFRVTCSLIQTKVYTIGTLNKLDILSSFGEINLALKPRVVFAGGSGICRYDNHRCRQHGTFGWHHSNSLAQCVTIHTYAGILLIIFLISPTSLQSSKISDGADSPESTRNVHINIYIRHSCIPAAVDSRHTAVRWSAPCIHGFAICPDVNSQHTWMIWLLDITGSR